MGFRVVEKSSFTFETDLPPSSINIHPSGVLHAFRTTTPTAISPVVSTNASGRDEHTFAWISNSLHVELAMKHLENNGFDRARGIVFIPYSTKRNWLDRYPHAAPALETTEVGKVVVYLNWRPYPNGLGELTAEIDDNDNAAAAAMTAMTTASGEKKTPVRKSRRPVNILQDNSYLPDPERDELHLEIYNYLSWLHSKLDAIEKKAVVAEDMAEREAVTTAMADAGEDGDSAKATAAGYKRKNTSINGVNVSELRVVVNTLESTFAIIPNFKLEEALETTKGPSKGVPFIEEALSKALKQLVTARELAGKPRRRSRKRQRPKSDGPLSHSQVPRGDFDMMFERLVQYKEEHGDCLVSKKHKEDPKFANWVHGIRERRKGIEGPEEVPPGKQALARTLTAERLERLNSIGFVWSVAGPTVAWEDRYQELLEYYEVNGKWPSQSMGCLGAWVHKQRSKYSRGNKNFMKTKAPKLDEVGFEWTPRGNTKMSWDEGFEMLMEFGRISGHFVVPCPTNSNAKVDVKSDAHRLFRWVESLHNMYRSYKLGLQSGSLTDERVVLLVKHGFAFRN